MSKGIIKITEALRMADKPLAGQELMAVGLQAGLINPAFGAAHAGFPLKLQPSLHQGLIASAKRDVIFNPILTYRLGQRHTDHWQEILIEAEPNRGMLAKQYEVKARDLNQAETSDLFGSNPNWVSVPFLFGVKYRLRVATCMPSGIHDANEINLKASAVFAHTIWRGAAKVGERIIDAHAAMRYVSSAG